MIEGDKREFGGVKQVFKGGKWVADVEGGNPASGQKPQEDQQIKGKTQTQILAEKTNKLKPINWGAAATGAVAGGTSLAAQSAGGVKSQGVVGSAATGLGQGMGLMGTFKPTTKGGLMGSGVSTGGAAAGVAAMGANVGGEALIKDEKEEAGGALKGAASGAAMGASIGSLFPGAGTAIGAGVGALAGGIAGAIGGKKARAERLRRNRELAKQKAQKAELESQQLIQNQIANKRMITPEQRQAALVAAGYAKKGVKTKCAKGTKAKLLKKKSKSEVRQLKGRY